jgi:hypothetical protein
MATHKIENICAPKLTCPRRSRRCRESQNPLFFLPLIISRTTTPKLKTSDFIEKDPCTAYSGGIYPLQQKTLKLVKKKDIRRGCDCT